MKMGKMAGSTQEPPHPPRRNQRCNPKDKPRQEPTQQQQDGEAGGRRVEEAHTTAKAKEQMQREGRVETR